ncbi:7476_t:CDS:1, partial [Gigaspora margarita]
YSINPDAAITQMSAEEEKPVTGHDVLLLYDQLQDFAWQHLK